MVATSLHPNAEAVGTKAVSTQGESVSTREPLCTAIEPVSKSIMCQLPASHPGRLHFAQGVDGAGGKWTSEWADLSRVKAYLRAQEAK